MKRKIPDSDISGSFLTLSQFLKHNRQERLPFRVYENHNRLGEIYFEMSIPATVSRVNSTEVAGRGLCIIFDICILKGMVNKGIKWT